MTIIWLNFASTWFMVGLIWLIQLVHYPLFNYVGSEEFIVFHENHKILITPVVGIVMIVELVTSVIILFKPSCGIRNWSSIVGIILLGIMAILIPEGYMVIALHGIIQLFSNTTRTFVFRNHLKTSLIKQFSLGAMVGLFIAGIIIVILIQIFQVGSHYPYVL